jgi:hypothetical protein
MMPQSMTNPTTTPAAIKQPLAFELHGCAVFHPTWQHAAPASAEFGLMGLAAGVAAARNAAGTASRRNCRRKRCCRGFAYRIEGRIVKSSLVTVPREMNEVDADV